MIVRDMHCAVSVFKSMFVLFVWDYRATTEYLFL